MAIDCLPVATREAMLEGVRTNPRILVGAYVDGQGGECPMLAAHRRGGRTDFLSFAKSWDRFTHAEGKARRATLREVHMLIAQLEASLEAATGMGLDEAIKEHRDLVIDRRRRRLVEGADPSSGIRARRIGRRRQVLVGDNDAGSTARRVLVAVSTRA